MRKMALLLNMLMSGAVALWITMAAGQDLDSTYSQGIYAAAGGLAFSDVDGDGYPDIAFSYATSTGYAAGLLINSGGTIPTSLTWSVSGSAYTPYRLVFGDVNRDGIVTETDYLSGDGVRTIFYLSRRPVERVLSVRVDYSNLSYSEYCHEAAGGWISLASAPSRGLFNIAVEYEYTTAPDIVIDSTWGGYPSLFLNTGSGTLETTPSWQGPQGQDSGIALGDLDGDGYPELAVADSGNDISVYANSAGALATSASWSVSYAYTYSVAFGDIDGDGDLDLAAGRDYSANFPGSDMVFINNGGTLDTTPYETSKDSSYLTYDVKWADVDRDADLDLACAMDGEDDINTSVFFNNGLREVFEENFLWLDSPWTAAGGTWVTWMVATGDVDMDGGLDLAMANTRGSFNTSYEDCLFLNTGSGFGSSPDWYSAYNYGSSDIGMVDIDLDGDLDLMTATAGNILVYENHSVRHVPEDYPTIQDAIDAASDGQVVRVAAGSYSENITLKEGVAVIGEGADVTEITTTSGNTVTGADRAIVSGFTITNNFWGRAGVYCSFSSPTIYRCVIMDSADEGIYCGTGTSPIIANCTIVGNDGYGGIGVDSGASPRILNCIITGTTGPAGFGAGIYNNSGSPTVQWTDSWGNYGMNYDGCSPGVGSFSRPPRLTPDLELRPFSPCRNAGRPDKGWRDEDGTRNDMGWTGGPGL